MPLAIAATRWSADYDLMHAAFAIPVGLLIGLGAIGLARDAQRRSERSLGRLRGVRTARIGRALGILGVCLALTAAISVAVYGLLEYAGTRE
jgi:hypothetical protein